MTRTAVAGSLARALQLRALGRERVPRRLNDVDLIVQTFGDLPASLAGSFLLNHVHPAAAEGRSEGPRNGHRLRSSSTATPARSEARLGNQGPRGAWRARCPERGLGRTQTRPPMLVRRGASEGMPPFGRAARIADAGPVLRSNRAVQPVSCRGSAAAECP